MHSWLESSGKSGTQTVVAAVESCLLCQLCFANPRTGHRDNGHCCLGVWRSVTASLTIITLLHTSPRNDLTETEGYPLYNNLGFRGLGFPKPYQVRLKE